MLEKHADTHLDHNLTPEQVDYLFGRFADRDAFFIETVELPPELGTVPCGLFGPLMGDPPVPEAEVAYARRGAREWESRLVDRAPRPTRQVTVIAGPHDGLPCVLFTMFGGPVAPREPGDPNAQVESAAFWRDHALAR